MPIPLGELEALLRDARWQIRAIERNGDVVGLLDDLASVLFRKVFGTVQLNRDHTQERRWLADRLRHDPAWKHRQAQREAQAFRARRQQAIDEWRAQADRGRRKLYRSPWHARRAKARRAIWLKKREAQR